MLTLLFFSCFSLDGVMVVRINGEELTVLIELEDRLDELKMKASRRGQMAGFFDDNTLLLVT